MDKSLNFTNNLLSKLAKRPRTSAQTPQYMAQCRNPHSIVTEGCIVLGKVENSVLSSCVEVGEGASVTNSKLMPAPKSKKTRYYATP
jgi:ADP-glucose pyrophosphorylase